LRKPPATWCGGWLGSGSVPTLAQAVTRISEQKTVAEQNRIEHLKCS
jgi:hypothetical protein